MREAPDRERLALELQKIEEAIATLRGSLSPELLAAALQPLHQARDEKRALLQGQGLIAQGNGIVAAAEGGTAVGGDVNINTTVLASDPTAIDPDALRRNYLEWVVKQCGYVSLADLEATPEQSKGGSELNLEAVYVALLTTEQQGWDEQGSRGRRAPDRLEERRPISAVEQLDRHKRLVLLGGPGSGKSTFVNFVTLCLAGEGLRKQEVNVSRLRAPLPDDDGEDAKAPQPWQWGALLPVRVILRDFAATGLPPPGEAASGEQLWEFIAAGLHKALKAELMPLLRKRLEEQGGLILLDGLDEVPDAEGRRAQVKAAVQALADALPRCRVLVTCRTYAYQEQQWPLSDFHDAELAPLSPGQIRRFVRQWYGYAALRGRLSESQSGARAELLERALFNRPALRELAERPLLLALMANLHAHRQGDLPDRRARLYEDILGLLLVVWERRRAVEDPAGGYRLIQESLAELLNVGPEWVRRAMEHLAFEAHARQSEAAGTADVPESELVQALMAIRGTEDIRPGRLVEHLRDRAGLLAARGEGVYTFPHRSFQEYLAACHLTSDAVPFPDKLAELGRSDPDRWREVVLLAAGKSVQGSAASAWQLAEALCPKSPGKKICAEDAWGAHLAAQVLVESADLDAVQEWHISKRDRIRDWQLRLLAGAQLPAKERVQAGNNLARLGDPRFDDGHWHLPRGPMLGFVEVGVGAFHMGSDKALDKDADDDELPRHEVYLPRYFIGHWPVTVAQYRAFVEQSGYPIGDADALAGTANHPVVFVSFHDALAYCGWLGERLAGIASGRVARSRGLAREFWSGLADGTLGVGLPSEAEWEKAARGDKDVRYPWGDEPSTEKANYEMHVGDTSPVGCFPGGASPCGCEEMAGNVWEWTRSLWGDYPYPEVPQARADREDLSSKDRRVLRGGAFGGNPGRVRCAARAGYDPDLRSYFVGFRVVVSPFFSER